MSETANLPVPVKVPFYAHVVLDRTGSMGHIREATVGAYNEYCESLKADPDIDVRISLTIFDSQSIDLIREKCTPDAAKITEDEYVPRAMTPLYDAIGKTVYAAEPVAKEYKRVAFVILTDGQENASREWTKAGVKALLERKQKDDNWLIVYLGANQDGMAEGVALGAMAANSMTYGADQKNIGGTFAVAATRSSNYAKTGDLKSGFTDADRKRVVE